MDYEDTANYTNSELYELRPSGSVVAKYEQTCAGDISEFNQLNHECQIDPHSNEIITLSYNIRSDYGTYESLEPLNTGMASKWRDAHGDDAAVNYCADALVAWDRTTGTTRQVGGRAAAERARAARVGSLWMHSLSPCSREDGAGRSAREWHVATSGAWRSVVSERRSPRRSRGSSCSSSVLSSARVGGWRLAID